MEIPKAVLETIAAYEDPTGWVEWIKGVAGDRWGTYWPGELAIFQRLLPKGDLLEVGCGVGFCATSLVAAGYDYVGIEPASVLREEAQLRNPGVTFMGDSLEELIFHPGTFDGFWASSVLLHYPKADVEEALACLHMLTKSGGIGFLTMKQGAGEGFDRRGRWFSYYLFDEFAEMLMCSGMEVLPESFVKPSEFKHDWLIYFVRVD